jgi:hypothetical protein
VNGFAPICAHMHLPSSVTRELFPLNSATGGNPWLVFLIARR